MPSAANEELEPGGGSGLEGCGSYLTVNPTLSQYSIVSNKSCSAIKHTGRSHSDIVPLGTSTRSMVLLQAEAFNSTQDNLTKEEMEWKYVDPPDTAYAWLVLACCCLVDITYGSLPSTSGIFLTEFLGVFGRSRQVTSWACTLQQSLGYFAGPLAGLMTDKFGHRTTIIVGCVGTGASLAVASLTSSFEVVFVAYGVLAGVFSSCIAIPATVCPAEYFRRHRVLALTITAGVYPLTFVVFGPLISTLLESYGWRVGALALATAFIQSTVLAVFLKPQRLKENWQKSYDSAWYTSTTSGFGKLRKDPSSHYTESHYSLYGEDAGKLPMSVLEQDSSVDKLHQSHTVLRSEYTLQMIPEYLPLQINTPTEKVAVANCKPAISSGESNIVQNHHTTSPKFKHLHLARMLKSIRQSPLCHWRLAILVAYNFMWGIGSSVFFVLLPELARYHSLTSAQIAQLIMLSGAVGFGCRIFVVIFFRFSKNCSKALFVFVALMVQSGALVGAALVESFVGFAMVTALFSFGSGATMTLATSTILEMHGDQRLAVVYGLQTMLYGLGYSISAPFAAWLYQQTNSYSVGFQCAAAVNFAGCLLLLPHIIQRYRNGTYKAN